MWGNSVETWESLLQHYEDRYLLTNSSYLMAGPSDKKCAFEAPAPLPAFSAGDKATLDGLMKWTGKELLGLRSGGAHGGK